MRNDGRTADALRPITIQRSYTRPAAGSVLITAGRTTVLCTASVELQVPPWMAGKGRGWVTAEYGMLPGSTSPRKRRDVSRNRLSRRRYLEDSRRLRRDHAAKPFATRDSGTVWHARITLPGAH